MSTTEEDDAPATQDVVKIHRSPPEKWRYECPRGHTNWSVINGVFRCVQCTRDHDAGMDVDPNHEVLVDSKTGEVIERDRIEIVLKDETIKW